MPVPPAPIRLAVVNDYELVVRGLAALLEPYADRIEVVELDSDVSVSQPVDVALYDAFSMAGLQTQDIDRLINSPHVPKLVLYTWALTEELSEEALARGVCAALPKSLCASDLVEAIERVHAGEEVVVEGVHETATAPGGSWPGKREGLTAREAEIVALITEGLSNNEIAQRTYLSINSVKSYIRSAYRAMGVSSRSQAVLWGIDHGFARNRRRVLPPTNGSGFQHPSGTAKRAVR